jgi:hypothetical protein
VRPEGSHDSVVTVIAFWDVTPCRSASSSDVSKIVVSLFSESSSPSSLGLDPEDEGTTMPRKVRNYSPNDTAAFNLKKFKRS